MLQYLYKTYSICSRTWWIFFFFKWLKHVLQIISFPSLWFMSGTHTSTAKQSGRLFLCTVTTLCLYHSWLHTQHLCTGLFPTSLWKFFIKSSTVCCSFLDVFFRSVSCICLRILTIVSFRTVFLLFVSHCCSFCPYSGLSLAICMPFLLNSCSLSLYSKSFLAMCMLFLFASRSPCLYRGSFLHSALHFLSHLRSLSLYTQSSLAACMGFLLHSSSPSLYFVFFLPISMYFLLRCLSLSLYTDFSLHCCSYFLYSEFDLAHFFHSVLYCCFLFLDLSAQTLCDCKYLSTIACASSGTFLFCESVAQFIDLCPLPDLFSYSDSFLCCQSTAFSRSPLFLFLLAVVFNSVLVALSLLF